MPPAGNRGYQPVLALWAEQDVIVADEFRDGNVPAGSRNRRVVEKAIAALPGGIDKIYLRGDSALYEHETSTSRFAGSTSRRSATRSRPIGARNWPNVARRCPRITGKPTSTRPTRSASGPRSIICPATASGRKTPSQPRRYLAIRIRPRQGRVAARRQPGAPLLHVTNRSDREGGNGLDLIRWHRQKAGTIEHAHDVLINELAGAALPRQKFGADAAWLRLDAILYNLLSAYKRVGLPEEFHTARPKRLRFLLLNTVAKVVRHAREILRRCTKQIARALAAPPPTRFASNAPS